MDVQEYISSGILELYVAGKLTEAENMEVNTMMQKHPEVFKEVLEIEKAIKQLTAAASRSKGNYGSISTTINKAEPKVIPIDSGRNKFISYSGWAAAILLGAALLFTINNNKKLQTDIQVVENEKEFLEQQIEITKNDLITTKEILAVLRDKNIIEVPLGGQAKFEESYATVYWDKNNKNIYLDAGGLPEPPKGKVYQVWSLKLSPLTPVSLGILSDFETDDNKIFQIANEFESEAFGITLEPEGGSVSPNLEQLYTLGAVAAVMP
ncbi:anti-sigma factor [Paucihalobacter sp.]|uniref:anti-sigma factor n=1 Tax=Paucihalobacter sp. TaxID=2850405 RepID=UPI002FDFD3A0